MSDMKIDGMSPTEIIPFDGAEDASGKKGTYTVTAKASTVKRGSSTDLQRKLKYETAQEVAAHRKKMEVTFHTEDKKLLLTAGTNTDLIEALMKYGKNLYGVPSLHLAVKEKDLGSMATLIKAGAELSKEVIGLAQEMNDIEVMQVLTKTQSFDAPDQYKFTMTKKIYNFGGGTEFELDSDDIPISYVTKPFFSLNTNYVLKGCEGIEATGTVQILSMGSIFPWAKDLDILDGNGNYLGMIDGEALTTADAKFSIYNANGDKVAIAYLDDNKTGFNIVHPDNYSRVIARMKREYVNDIPDAWSTKVYQGDDVDPRLLKIFAALAVDTEGLFKADK
ncbi:hypothetical protein COB11_04690 [Candidatus Aerophobetes bacterium]|uniref:Uncharacterized protein n=1 Tax=Aerophobetes bacterium TaxID=2030807 RepID=A0A2A4YG32_UNCAE|nr:MAG: hypothetical protein COB11_04690 [Candidatus Aerophobetes bacterium]